MADDGRNRWAWVSRASAWRALRRGVLVPCLVWALVSVAPAWSAELVEVRVGNHPTFTRVVFEFDAATGYRVERRAEGEAENVIVVTLDAASRPRNIVSRSPGVASVSVEEGFDRAIARISTRKPGLPIKEMILRDPPRIVLDLMLGDETRRSVAPAGARARPGRVAEPEPAPERDRESRQRRSPRSPRAEVPRRSARAGVRSPRSPASRAAQPEPRSAAESPRRAGARARRRGDRVRTRGHCGAGGPAGVRRRRGRRRSRRGGGNGARRRRGARPRGRGRPRSPALAGSGRRPPPRGRGAARRGGGIAGSAVRPQRPWE